MTTFELIAYSGAAIFSLASAFKITSACAFRIIRSKTLTLRFSLWDGIEIKAESSRPSLPQAKD